MTLLPHRIALVGLLALFGAAPAAAGDPPPDAPVDQAVKAARPHHVYLVGSLRVTQPWVDVGGAATNSGNAYLIVENRGSVPERLTAASVAGADRVSLIPGGSDGPLADKGLTVPANGRLVLQPGDAHLALQGLHGVAPGGPPIDGLLRFERAGSLHLSFATDHAEAVEDDESAPMAEDRPVDLSK